MNAAATASGAIDEPVLTLPPAEAGAVRAAYEAAEVILEYGSGGSTVMAARMAGKHVTSVESDGDWAEMMRTWLKQNPTASKVEIVHGDIGPTGDWGYPKKTDNYQAFPAYIFKPWQRRGFRQPDVVLVDGRFRAGCMLAVAALTRAPVTLLVDDYIDRAFYHRAEEIIGAPDEMIGRMARFSLKPRDTLPADALEALVTLSIKPL